MAAFLAVLVATASATVAAAEGSAWVIRHGPRAEKVVALTFDDGWGRAASERILAVLIAENVPATFFPYALAVRSNPVLWRRIAEAGFPIGNHTWSHPRMTSLTQHEMEWQIAASKRLIESVTGVPMLRVFRPPYGRYDRRVLAAAANQGFPTVLLWDASAGDSGAGPSRASVLRGASAGRNGSVVLLHAARTVTASALRAIIRSYRSRGFRFVTVPELLGEAVAPWPTPSPSPAPSTVPWPTLGPTPSGPPDPGSAPTPAPSGGPVPTAAPPPTAVPVPSPTPGPPLPPGLTRSRRSDTGPSPRTAPVAS